MTDYTKDAHALPYPQGVDRVAVAADIQALAVKTGIAITLSESSARTASNNYTDGVARSTRSDLEATLGVEVGKDRERLGTLEGTTVPKALADAKTYADDEVGKDRKWLAELEVKGAVQDSSLIELKSSSPTVFESDSIVAVAVSASEERTWVEYRETDGGPTDWSMTHIESRLGVAAAELDTAEEWPALTDANGMYTDLVVRSSDGRIPNRILNDWKSRMSLAAGASFHERDGELVEATARQDLSIWGSSTLDAAGNNFATFAHGKGVPFYAGGVSGNWTQHVMARMGVTPAELTFPDNTIPDSGSVLVTATNLPVFQFPAFAVTVAGVPGRLSGTHQGVWTFIRDTAGQRVSVPSSVPAVPITGPAHRADTIILNAGKNNLSHSGTASDVIAHNKRIVAWLSPIAKRALIMGDFVDTGTAADAPVRTKIYEANALRKAWAGRAYFDSHAFTTGPMLWEYTGLTPTAEDLTQQAIGNKPPSASKDNGHFNDVGSVALTRAVTDYMTTLGWY